MLWVDIIEGQDIRPIADAIRCTASLRARPSATDAMRDFR